MLSASSSESGRARSAGKGSCEQALARRLFPRLQRDWLLIADRGFHNWPDWQAAAGRAYANRVRSPPGAAAPAAGPDVAATVRLIHRRQGWGRTAATSFIAFLLGAGAYSSANSQGTPPPSWFLVIVIVLGAVTIAGLAAAVVDTALLRRRSPAIRAQAVPLAAHHPSRPHAHHYPPRHRVSWAIRWIGMLLILVVAVVSVPGVVDGVAYLAGAGNTVTFDPVSYQTDCYVRGGCQTSTDGILETGGTGVDATWPDVVPLGRPFQVREPVWRWGLGEALIDSRGIAVAAVLVSLLIEGAAVFVVISLVRLARNWVRHRRQRTAPQHYPAALRARAGPGAGAVLTLLVSRHRRWLAHAGEPVRTRT